MSLRTLEKMLFLHITKYNSTTRTGASRLFVYFQTEKDTTTPLQACRFKQQNHNLKKNNKPN